MKFIGGLEKRTCEHIEELLGVLAEYGYEIRMPYSKPISRGVFELRIRGQQEVRLFYKFKENTIIIFYGFIKKTESISLHELRNINRLASLV